MATETVKLILGIGETLTGRLLLYDSLRMNFKNVRIRRNPACELCGDSPTVKELVDYEAFCSVQLPGAAAAAAQEAAFEIGPEHLKQVLQEGRPVTLVDVREPHEWAINRIDGAQLMPLSQFEQFIPKLKPEDDIYLYCYKGKRSMTALKKLQEAGFQNLHSLEGGIDKWAETVAPDMPRY